MSKKGYVYVLTNPSFRDDWVKIGYSKKLPEIRGKELFNTAVPLPFEIYATLYTEKYKEAERLIHNNIDRISNLRIHKKREFFNIPPEVAYEILCDVKEVLGEEAVVELMGDNVEVKVNDSKGSRKKSKQFDFYSRGIKDGDVITFVDDKSIKAIVQGPRNVLFENKLWYLSRLARELYTRLGTVNSSGAYQGPKYFEYKGKILTELPILKGETKKPSKRFDFYSRGLKDGDVVTFVGDESIKATVAGPRKVFFENKLWYLSPLARELYTRLDNVYASGAYQGPLYFKHNGKRLTDLPIVNDDQW